MNKTIFNISKIFSLKGVKRMVLSPGSRNAPLTVSFARNPDIEVYNIVDERSAGFIANGISLKSKQPVAVCCTSGSALLNYAPAVSEAFYQNIPLIVLSADRPPEWIDQRDGQTINQSNALRNFVKGFFQLPVDLEHEDAKWEFNRKINEAINLAMSPPFGPVHINVPFREPFYPAENEKLGFDDVRIIEQTQSDRAPDFSELNKQWSQFKKKLIVVGQQFPDEQLDKVLSNNQSIPIIADVISNIHAENTIRSHDLFLGTLDEKQLEILHPDLLITTGKSLISKNLKLFIRKHKPKAHWHFEETTKIADTFKTLTHHINASLDDFLKSVEQTDADEFANQLKANYLQSWKSLDEKCTSTANAAMEGQEFSEMMAFKKIVKSIPDKIDLHLANSMAVRYANFFQRFKSGIEVYANRGTSGIDGSNGTAVGNTLVGEHPVVLLTGDLSFFYDRNAFFHQYNLNRLKIILINNQGGGIFRLIKGPSDLPELEQHFETRHQHSAKFTAAEYDFDYFKAKDEKSLDEGLKLVFKDEKAPKILEIFTDPEENSLAFKRLKNAIKNSYHN